MRKISKAIISVSDKSGVIEFARALEQMDVEILSTGGTARILKENNISVTLISDYTKFPEILNGRVKTLNPLIHGGILGKTSDEGHRQEMEKNNISPIDLVVVNLYPFEETIAKKNVAFDAAIEQIDIGGPAMLRSAAKNCDEVTVVVCPEDYDTVICEMKDNNNQISKDLRIQLACKVFSHTFRYDGAIASYFDTILSNSSTGFKSKKTLRLEKIQDLRYGENPHQKATFYRDLENEQFGVSGAEQLNGKELSFNNIIDIDAAYLCVNEFEEIASVVVKHTNPCGVASGDTVKQAYVKARATDPVSAFGGIIGFNRTVDNETAREVISSFVEAIIAPDYTDDALSTLKTKKNLRILKAADTRQDNRAFDLKKVSGGILIQDSDQVTLDEEKIKVSTKRNPTKEEWEALRFAWTVAKHVKSNAIVYAKAHETVGIGAGQMSRVDSSRIAVQKAQKEISGSVMASDAFFPFRDSIDAAAKAGITAIIQPGGSIRDEEVIAASDEHNIAMVFTGIRHFKH